MYRWITTSRAEQAFLSELSRRLKDPCRKIPFLLEDEIYNPRVEYMWCADKISGYMKKKGIGLAQSTQYKISKKKGIDRPLEKPLSAV